ncbi:MAG: hypothetical protein LBO66_10095 [Deltaproteobacteria bacterium]|nr:hypothetical protein [Deltaproteobacteria bacterium]
MDFPIKEAIFIQSVVEVALLATLFWVLWRTRQKPPAAADPAAMPSELRATIERFLSESAKIAQAFSQNLAEKKKLSEDLIIKLDGRVRDYRALLAATEAAMAQALRKLEERDKEEIRLAQAQAQSAAKANPAEIEVRALVLKLAKEGQSVEEIATRARLHRGEVELIIDLDGHFNI